MYRICRFEKTTIQDVENWLNDMEQKGWKVINSSMYYDSKLIFSDKIYATFIMHHPQLGQIERNWRGKFKGYTTNEDTNEE